jgi:hypothetical protein
VGEVVEGDDVRSVVVVVRKVDEDKNKTRELLGLLFGYNDAFDRKKVGT